VAVVKVGAATEVELKEKKHRIEDALSATRAAIEEGIVAGGGTALVVPAPRSPRRLESSTATSAPVPARAQGPRGPGPADRRQRRPRGRRRGPAVSSAETGNIGLNAATGEFEDLVKAGVIDPAKVTRAALQNAASIAGLLLTTEASCRQARGGRPRRRRHARHGRHGRHGRGAAAP
jgi:chaperonin GroEL